MTDHDRSDLAWIHAHADPFDAELNQALAARGEPPRIEDFLPDAPEPRREALFRELLCIELECLLKDGRTLPGACLYQARFPEYAGAIESALRDALGDIVPSSSSGRGGVGDQPYSAADEPRFGRVRLLAEGGLGRVSVARDRELQRDVALKEIKPQFLNDPRSQQRFRHEAEITGRLEHPGVVPVYSLGNDSLGRPYYAMRLIDGVTFLQALENYHRDGCQPTRLRRLLSRFIAVCQTIAYAHAQGVIHRDLKPANIMVGRFGETLVVDWGLAKFAPSPASCPGGEAADARDDFPRGGSSDPDDLSAVAGTPAYMSPEQSAGSSVTKRSNDIYSLGATLYHLLTGKPPAGSRKGGSSAAEASPPLARSIPRPLAAICRKAMSPRPEDRYRDAQEMAGDLECYLADERVAALAEGPLDKASRWARKHRAWVQAGAVSLLLLAAVSVAFAMMVNQQRVAAQALAAKNLALAKSEEAARIEAEQKEAEARATNDFMAEVFFAADPLGILGSPRGPAPPEGPASVRDLLDHGLQCANEQLKELPLVRARVLESIGTAYRAIGECERAEPLLLESLRVREERLGPNHPDVASAAHFYGWLLYDLGRFDESEQSLRRARKIREDHFPGDDPRVLSTRFHLAWALSARFERQIDYERRREAEQLIKSVVEARSQRLGAGHRDTTVARLALAVMQLASHETRAHALKTLADIAASDSWSLAPMIADYFAAVVLRQAGRHALAEAGYRRVCAKAKSLFGPSHMFTLLIEGDYAGLLREMNRVDEALSLIEQTIQRARRSSFRWHPLLAEAMLQVGDLHRGQNRLAEARSQYADALVIAEKIGKSDVAAQLRQRLAEIPPAP